MNPFQILKDDIAAAHKQIANHDVSCVTLHASQETFDKLVQKIAKDNSQVYYLVELENDEMLMFLIIPYDNTILKYRFEEVIKSYPDCKMQFVPNLPYMEDYTLVVFGGVWHVADPEINKICMFMINPNMKGTTICTRITHAPLVP